MDRFVVIHSDPNNFERYTETLVQDNLEGQIFKSKEDAETVIDWLVDYGYNRDHYLIYKLEIIK